jgi:hypothetical protein
MSVISELSCDTFSPENLSSWEYEPEHSSEEYQSEDESSDEESQPIWKLSQPSWADLVEEEEEQNAEWFLTFDVERPVISKCPVPNTTEKLYYERISKMGKIQTVYDQSRSSSNRHGRQNTPNCKTFSPRGACKKEAPRSAPPGLGGKITQIKPATAQPPVALNYFDQPPSPTKLKAYEKKVNTDADTYKNCMSPTEAWELQKKLHVVKLAKTLVCEEALSIQKKGYVFSQVLTKQKNYAIQGKVQEYMILDIPENEWGDKILFVKSRPARS